MGSRASRQVCRCLAPGRFGEDYSSQTDENCDGNVLVELAASELFSLPAIGSAYHTSILVNGEEFFFSEGGVLCDRTLASHPGAPTERRRLGRSSRTGQGLLNVLQSHFTPGSYDLILKNCNSFSDAAIFYLLGTRLERRYQAVEKAGRMAGKEMVRKFTNGSYDPNPLSLNFKVEDVIAAVRQLPAGETLPSSGSESSGPINILAPGARVTIVGLTGSSMLNGKGALVKGHNPLRGRWEVIIVATGETKSVRADNLRPAGEPVILLPGDLVRVHWPGALQDRREGTVLQYRHDIGRYEVRLGLPDEFGPEGCGSETIPFLAGNLRPAVGKLPNAGDMTKDFLPPPRGATAAA